MGRFIVMVLLLVASAIARAGEAGAPAGVESARHRDARMAWWREARFGMFIHSGLYAIPGQGEWVMYAKKIPVATYAANAATFNPAKFDARQIVATAKSAGMKHLVITAKHHEGFAMFATKASDYNIMDATPFKRDVIRELSDACRKGD
jgi:alpha-L-fucosidase